MAVDVGSAVGYLDLDISGFMANLNRANDEADKQTKNLATKIENNISGAGKTLASAGTTLTRNVTVPLLGVGAAGIKVAVDFEKGMSEVKAISGATGKDFDVLKDKAIELGADTAFSANEVASAMTEMAKAGWDSQQIIEGMGGVLNAAAASGEGLASVSTIVADTITGFGMEAKDSTKVADLLTQAANSGTIGIADLGESFKYIAPVAGSMGLSVEDVTTALSAMSMAGIKGSQAGTSLRTMLTRMVKPTDAVAVAMDELGITLTNQDGSFKSLDTIVGEMRGSFGELTDEQKTYYAATLAGQEGMSGVLSLLNLTQEEYDEISKSMNNSAGVAEKTAEIMQDNLGSKLEQLGGSLESLAIKLADLVLPYIQQFVVWLTGLVDKFTELNPETQKTILKLVGIAAAAGPVLTIFGKITTVVGGAITAFGKIGGGFKAVAKGGKAGAGALAKFGGALAGVTAPVAAVAAVIGALAAAFVTLWKNNEEFRDKITEIWNQVKETFDNFANGIVKRLNSFGFNFSSITEVLKAAWTGFCNLLAPVFTGAFQIVADTFKVITDVILGIFDIFVAIFTGDWEGAWNGIKGTFESIWNGIVAFFTTIGSTLTGVLDTICSWFGTTWEATWNSIKLFFETIWNGIVTWFKETLIGISTFFSDTWNGIVEFISGILTGISETFTNIWNGITSFLSSAWETIKNVVSSGIMFIRSLISFAFQLITIPFRFIWENCKEIIISAWEAIKTAVSNALSVVRAKISEIWGAVLSFLATIWTSISSLASTVWNAIKTAITNIVNGIHNSIVTIWNRIKAAVANAVNSIKITVTNVWNAIKSTVTNAVDNIKSAVSRAFNSVKSTTQSIWNSVKDKISNTITAAKDKVSSTVENIQTSVSRAFNAAKNTVYSVWNSIKEKITNTINGAKDAVYSAIEKIKSFFNFEWSLPKLKMPHFVITGSFSLNPPSAPSFAVEWYKKAMGNGMILDSATIFGFNSKTGKFLGGGEAGSETVVGTKNLLSMIKQSVYEAIGPLVLASRELAQASGDLGYVTYNGFTKLKEAKDAYVRENRNGDSNGDTFVFYSPTAIDEIEAAKQMKRAKRELAEGF